MTDALRKTVADRVEAPRYHRWALITVTYNSSADLRRFWSNLQLNRDLEWVVVDNNSTDDSVAVARDLGARVIGLPKNIGFGAANNVGFAASDSRYVGFVNPDITVVPDDLRPLEAVIDETGGIVAPQLTDPDGTPQPNGRGYPFLLEKVRNRLELNAKGSAYRRFAPAGEDIAVVWFMGAAVLGQRSQLDQLGPWDERFFVYYEDSDLGLRAARLGLPRTVTGSVRWIHGWARETTAFRWTPWKLEFPSMAKFYLRYPYLLSPLPRTTAHHLTKIGWPRR